MYQTVMEMKRILVLGAMLVISLLVVVPKPMAMDMQGHEMTSHHQHLMLNHSLGMVLEGHNIVMEGSMGMANEVDAMSVEHGNMMIKNGTALYNEIMTGKDMMGMHHAGKDPMEDPAMAYTHKLAEKQLIVMDLLNKMPKMEAGTAMAMHHQHIMLNHALKMAVDGSNMVMLGKMGMAGEVDKISVEHGQMMLKNAKGLFNEIMSGGDMMEMHKKGTAPEKDEGMKYTHKLAEAQLQVITLLGEMP